MSKPKLLELIDTFIDLLDSSDSLNEIQLKGSKTNITIVKTKETVEKEPIVNIKKLDI